MNMFNMDYCMWTRRLEVPDLKVQNRGGINNIMIFVWYILSPIDRWNLEEEICNQKSRRLISMFEISADVHVNIR